MSTRPDPEQIVRNFFRDYCISGTLSPTEAETPVSSAALRSAQVMPAAALADQTLLAAVSGGADSLFLLIMLHTLAPEYGFTLSAVTVNHRMRSEEESGGDAGFVQEFCAALNPPVPCYRIDLPEGAVFVLAKTRGRGEEDAARVLRYREFDRIARQSGVRWICTGHTRNDQLETLLMRTLQGSPVGAKRGIAPISGRIMRPLLGVDRRDLEKWLRARGYSWREDHTNREERYLRNRIRSRLVPVLDASFAGWARGMLAGARKAAVDEQFISSFPLPEWTISPSGCSCSASEFFALHPALRIRFLYRGIALLNRGRRIPYALVEKMTSVPENGKSGTLVTGSGLVFARRESLFFLESDIVQKRKSGYLVYIASCGEYELPFGTLRVSGEPGSVYLDGQTGPFPLPLIVRSRMGGDWMQTADGGKKSVKKIMNDWSVRECDREVLPVIECGGSIRAVYGTPLGYPRWYVHQQESNG